MDSIRPWLYIGKYRDTLNRALLRAHNIHRLLQMAEPTPYPDITHLYLPVEDGLPLDPVLLAQGVTFVRTAYSQGQITLIACGAGISRSAVFATAALKEIEALPLLQAWQIVYQAHREALPHPALWKSLGLYYHEPVPLTEMLRSMRNKSL